MKNKFIVVICLSILINACRSNSTINNEDKMEAIEILKNSELDLLEGAVGLAEPLYPLESCVIAESRRAWVVFSQDYKPPGSSVTKKAYVVKFDDNSEKDIFDETLLKKCE